MGEKKAFLFHTLQEISGWSIVIPLDQRDRNDVFCFTPGGFVSQTVA